MDRAAKQLREAARALVVECGPYAMLAALFLASEALEGGEAEDAAAWARIAGLIPEIEGLAGARPSPLVAVVAGRA